MSDYPLRAKGLPRVNTDNIPLALRRFTKTNSAALLLVLLIGGYIAHRGWFGAGIIGYGDWFPLSSENMRTYWRLPAAWDTGRGLGGFNVGLPSFPIEGVFGIGSALGLSYATTERLFVFFPFTFLPFLSAYYLSTRFVKLPVFRALSAMIFGLNTYILLVGNGQMTVAIAYAVTPFAVAATLDAMRHIRTNTLKPVVLSSLLAGGWLGVAAAFDIRIAYVSTALCLWLLFAATLRDRHWQKSVFAAALILGMIGAVNAWWLLVAFLGGTGSSFAGLLPTRPWISWSDVTHGLTLEHPFWTGSTPAAFSVSPPSLGSYALPLVAFSALLFKHTRRDWRVASFAVVAVVSVFLVKGENPPIGGLYTWLFDHVPGMNMFRDMSKFTILTAIAYAVLIPVTLEGFIARNRSVKSSSAAATQWLAVGATAIVALTFMWSARPALAGDLGATLDPHPLPSDFASVNAQLDADKTFGRVLWVPTTPSYSTRTSLHPAVSPADISPLLPARNDGLGAFATLDEEPTANVIRAYGVKYVVLSTSPNEYLSWPSSTDAGKTDQQRIIRERLANASWLRFDRQVGDLTVWEVAHPLPFAFVASGDTTTPVAFEGRQSAYRTASFAVSPGVNELNFAESFDARWKATYTGVRADGSTIALTATHSPVASDAHSQWAINVPEGVRTVNASLTFPAQRFVNAGTVITGLAILLFIGVGVWLRIRKSPSATV